MVTIDFEKFNKAGLKQVLSKFEKADLPIETVDADNKAKRDSGFLVKTATINFESGQKLVLKAKAGGSIFQARLNGKVLAIKNYLDLDKAIQEVVDFVKENEANYKKQREKQLSLQKIKVPKIKAVNSSVSEQIAQIQATIDETKASDDSLIQQITEMETSKVEKTSKVATLETELNTLVQTGDQLQAEYNALKEGGVMESAGSSCTDDEVTEEDIEEGEKEEEILEAAAIALPGLNKWDTWEGGTSAEAGKKSYSIRMDGGDGPRGLVEYHIDPVSNSSGRHKGYSLTSFGLPGAPLWRWISPNGQISANGSARFFSKPQDAVKVAQEIHDKNIVNKVKEAA